MSSKKAFTQSKKYTKPAKHAKRLARKASFFRVYIAKGIKLARERER